MNKKIKYCVAVAAIAAATVFCGCESGDGEVVPIEKAQPEPGPDETGARDDDSAQEKAEQQENVSQEGKAIKVYVCGAVRYPDVYTVDGSCRTVDAVEAAGGFLPEAGLDYINLAAGVSDGQKIYIPTKKEIEEALAQGDELYSTVVNITSNTPGVNSGSDANSQANGGDSSSDLVDINSASKETLMTLPGIGESKADKIIAYREANGGFSSIEDIMLVGGIKEGLFNKVKDRICAR